MKSKILANLTSLMNADELEDKLNLQIQAAYLIGLADFGMEKESERLKKNEIISALSSYVENSDKVHRELLGLHLSFIEARNVCEG